MDGGWLEHGGSGMRDDQRRSAGGNGSNACYLSRARDGSYVSHLLVFRDDGVMMDRVDGDGDEGMCFPIGVVGSSSVMGDGI